MIVESRLSCLGIAQFDCLELRQSFFIKILNKLLELSGSKLINFLKNLNFNYKKGKI